MKTSDNSDVIQGDEQCRDGHYRAKQDLRIEDCDQHRRRSRGGAGSERLDFRYRRKTHLIWVTSGSGLPLKRLPAFRQSGIPCCTELVIWVRFDRPKLS